MNLEQGDEPNVRHHYHIEHVPIGSDESFRHGDDLAGMLRSRLEDSARLDTIFRPESLRREFPKVNSCIRDSKPR